MYPLPNSPGTETQGYNYVSQESSDQPRRQDLLRIDWQASTGGASTASGCTPAARTPRRMAAAPPDSRPTSRSSARPIRVRAAGSGRVGVTGTLSNSLVTEIFFGYEQPADHQLRAQHRHADPLGARADRVPAAVSRRGAARLRAVVRVLRIGQPRRQRADQQHAVRALREQQHLARPRREPDQGARVAHRQGRILHESRASRSRAAAPRRTASSASPTMRRTRSTPASRLRTPRSASTSRIRRPPPGSRETSSITTSSGTRRTTGARPRA